MIKIGKKNISAHYVKARKIIFSGWWKKKTEKSWIHPEYSLYQNAEYFRNIFYFLYISLCIALHMSIKGIRPMKYIVAQVHELRVHFPNRNWIEWIKHYEMLMRVVRCQCKGITWNTYSEIAKGGREWAPNKNPSAKRWNASATNAREVSDCTVSYLWNAKKWVPEWRRKSKIENKLTGTSVLNPQPSLQTTAANANECLFGKLPMARK